MKNQYVANIPGAVYRAIHFSQPLSFGELTEFYHVPSLLFASLREEEVDFLLKKDKDGVAQLLRKREKELMQGRETLNLSNDPEARLPEALRDLAEGIFGEESSDTLLIYFGLSGLYDLIIKSNRVAVSELEQISLLPQSAVRLRSPFLFYSEDKYSIALKSPELSLALVTAPGARGGKGNVRLLLKLLTPEALYIDDAAKYFNTELFLQGVNI